MPIDTAIILGLIQGVTEFIPVSSTGHLILGREAIVITSGQALAFDAVLQTATALAILAYFWRDLRALLTNGKEKIAHTNIDISFRPVMIIAVATIPAAVAGLLLEDMMATVFRTPEIVAGALILGSFLMLAAEHLPKTSADRELTFGRGFSIGLFQALALVPGMSRSGSTISGGLLAGFDRQTATSFSFLLGLPILLGAGGKKFLDLISSGALSTLGLPLFVASVVAFFSGLLAMHVLIRFVRDHRLDWFAGYRIILAVVVLLLI